MLLLSNPKVSPIQLAVLLPQIYNIITPLTNLSCSACSLALQSYNEESHSMMVCTLVIYTGRIVCWNLHYYVLGMTSIYQWDFSNYKLFLLISIIVMYARVSFILTRFNVSISCCCQVTALDVLKIIISTKKVQIGPHISCDVVHLLFTVAEMGAESDSVFHRFSFSVSDTIHLFIISGLRFVLILVLFYQFAIVLPFQILTFW